MKKIPYFVIGVGLAITAILWGIFKDSPQATTQQVYAAAAYTGDIPSYYSEQGTTADGLKLYSLENVSDSSGMSKRLYRATDGTYLYAATSDGHHETEPLTAADITAEKPQPSISGSAGSYTNNVAMNAVGPNINLQYDLAGQYTLNYAASSNIYGLSATNAMGGFLFDGKENTTIPIADEAYGSYMSTSTSEGTLKIASYTMDKTIKGNASKATLSPSSNAAGDALDKTSIKAAYLVMETSLDITGSIPNYATPNEEVITELQNMGNRPMTLVGPSGAAAVSNGYLPEGFSVAYDASYSSSNPGLDTSSSDLSSDTPTIMYTLGGRTRVRATTITDVTEFVRQEGYGDYYGYHIPTKAWNIGVIADVACGWKLIVIEEDPSMTYSRVGALQLGIINSSRDHLGTTNLNLTADLGGYTTPQEDDFKGQLFFSSVGSNPQGEQYLVSLDPDGTGSTPGFYLETRDRSGGNINRGYSGTSRSFGQNMISIDGQRRTDMTSFRLSPKGGDTIAQWTLNDFLTQTANSRLYTDGLDVELLNVTNKQEAISASTTKHNAYIANKAKEISLNIAPSTTGDNYITILGVLVETELPTFTSAISHTDIASGVEGGEIYASDNVKVTATTKNVTKASSDVAALTDTQAVVTFDSSLTVDWSSLSLVFKNYAEDGTFVEHPLSEFTQTSSLAELNTNRNTQTYYIDTAANTITINFGADETAYETDGDKNTGNGQIQKLYNNVGDSLEVSVIAQTSSTVEDAITNTIEVTGGDAINKNDLIVPVNAKTYATSTDTFNTYNREALLHIRQVVTSPHSELVVPMTGFGAVTSKDTADNTLAAYPLEYSSSEDENLAFDTYLLQYPEDGQALSYESIIPQYYERVGYVVTATNSPHAVGDAAAGVTIDAETQPEIWVTVYITPSTDSIKLYSWDYKENDFGTLTVP